MRPHELTVEGFRSYRKKTTFDWRGRRLVGIVGPIGSGKSSIIDAISFALFGKTPSVERDTKSLIHQLCDQCHVELVFEVDGQVWQVQRALRSNGQAGSKLRLVTQDGGEPDVPEIITGVRTINERIEQLLGMDFDAFRRSVLLAQNRFSEFLKATAGDRDKVLKGVFGYEVLDGAQRVAKSRLDRAETDLEALGDERRRIDEARARLEESRANAASAERRLRDLEAAAPEVERLTKERDAAAADDAASAEQIAGLIQVTASLPNPDDVDAAVAAASAADEVVAAAEATFEAAEQVFAQRQVELGDVATRLGDRERFRSFDRLVQQQEQESKALDATRADLEQSEGASTAAIALVERRGVALSAAVTALDGATDVEVAAAGTVEEARVALADAQHAEMAHELRGALVAGAPCPVCDQPVGAIPKGRAAPKVAAAVRAVEKAEASLGKVRDAKERASQARASAATAVDEAVKRAEESAANHGLTVERVRAAEAAIATTNAQLVEWLGEGDARSLLEARQAELDAAEHAVKEAQAAVDASRTALEQTRGAATQAGKQLTSFANKLSGAWGRLGEDRDVAADPTSLRDAFVSLGEAVLARHADAEQRRADARDRIEQATSASAELLSSVGLAPGDDFRTELTEAGIRHGAAAVEVTTLEAEIGRANELEGRIVDAESRRDLARRLSDDLKPSRFLAFLLEEERAELADLGSEHFEQLTDGAYRFADDGSFAVQDLNAAGQVRKADSLSGGETFLASLALALALAEMVARGGGRLDSFFLDEGFGSLDPEHLDRAMDGIGRLVSENERRLVVLVSHVAEMREAIEDLVVLDKDDVTGDTIVRSGGRTRCVTGVSRLHPRIRPATCENYLGRGTTKDLPDSDHIPPVADYGLPLGGPIQPERPDRTRGTMAGQKNIYRIARTLLLALAALLAVGAVGSMFMGSRAVSQAKSAAVDQARTIVENSLPITLAPSDVTSPATDAKADLITSHITPVLLDPSAWDDVAIWSLDGQIVYATDRSLIGQRPDEARSSVRDATESGTVSSEQRDGMFSVLIPLRFRSDGPIAAAIQLARPDDLIAAAGRPWRYNAILMTLGLIVTLFILYRVMRLASSASANASFSPAARDRVAPGVPHQVAAQRPLELASPGLREEAEARRKAQERATAAEERLDVIQDQYRKTLEELHITQRMLQERPTSAPAADPNPELEARVLKSEGQARLLEGELQAMSAERDKLARHIAEQAKNAELAKAKGDPEADRKTKQIEQEAIGLRAELEGAHTELSLTRRELDALKPDAERAQELQQDLDAAHVEALHAREAAESAQGELSHATAELVDVRNELRALRTEEQKASIFGEELRAARAEIDSLKASHAADLVEREAELEARVRSAREEFQAQIEQSEAETQRLIAEREAETQRLVAEREEALTKEAVASVAELRRAADEREAELQTQLAEREAELQHRLAEREATLQEQISEQAELLEQKLSQREAELTGRITEIEAGSSATKSELEAANAELAKLKGELQAARDEIEAAANAGSSRNEQVAKANEELVRSRTEIETLQQEFAEIQRGRDTFEAELQRVTQEREALRAELAAASAEVQTELARGVELSTKADAAEEALREAREATATTEQELERIRSEQERLVSAFEDAKARHAEELATSKAAAEASPDLEEILRTSQERLASQTEKLIEVEERAHSAERQFADAVVRLEEVEAELRHLQMEKALHDLQTERPAAETTTVDATTIPNVPLEDRRSSTPFTKELALDAKKSLSHILGLTQIMKYKKDSKDQAQLIKQLTAAARRLDHTVADLSEADALAHGVVDLTIKRTDLEALLKRVVDESGIGTDHDVRIDSQPLVVGVDSLRVEQVVAGLLRFCGDRTATGKAITVRLGSIDGGALISVEDPEPSNDGSLSPVITRFVEMQGGWTKIENREGGGSAFRVFLPDGGPSGETPIAPPSDDVAGEDEAAPPGTLQIVVAEPSEQESADAWGSSEEQLFVQELHRLHAED